MPVLHLPHKQTLVTFIDNWRSGATGRHGFIPSDLGGVVGADLWRLGPDHAQMPSASPEWGRLGSVGQHGRLYLRRRLRVQWLPSTKHLLLHRRQRMVRTAVNYCNLFFNQLTITFEGQNYLKSVELKINWVKFQDWLIPALHFAYLNVGKERV